MSKHRTSTEETTTTVSTPFTGRITRTKQKVHIDHYKLKVASKMANIGLQGARKEDGDHEMNLVKQEHVHFFHTYDSNGKKQTRSSSIAGHTHQITEISQGPGQPPKITVGPAVKEVRSKDKKTKKWIISYAPADDGLDDNEVGHTHEPEYLWSEEVETRDINAEALKLESYEANKGAAVAGVVG